MNAIGANDVLCGRGGATNNHIGNKHFRSICAEYQEVYLKARKKDKTLIAQEVLARVKENGGRFLKFDTTSSVWLEIPNKKALLKTSQALREGLDMRKGKIRPEKMPRHLSDSRYETPRMRPRLVEGKVCVTRSPGLTSVASSTDQNIPDLKEEQQQQQQPVNLNNIFDYYRPQIISGVNLEAV